MEFISFIALTLVATSAESDQSSSEPFAGRAELVEPTPKPAPPEPRPRRGLFGLGISLAVGGGSQASLALPADGAISVTGALEVQIIGGLELGLYGGWGRRFRARYETYDPTASTGNEPTIVEETDLALRQWLVGAKYELNPDSILVIAPFLKAGIGTLEYSSDDFDRTMSISGGPTVVRAENDRGVGLALGFDCEHEVVSGLRVGTTLTVARWTRLDETRTVTDPTLPLNLSRAFRQTRTGWNFSGEPAAAVEVRLDL